MALFEEKKVEGKFADTIKLADMNIGESIVFYFGLSKDLPANEFGESVVWEGLRLDTTKANPKEAIESSIFVSLWPNTQLRRMNASGSIITGRLYRIEKAWNRGDKFKGKPAKGFGYNVFELNLNEELKSLLTTTLFNRQTTATPVEVDSKEL